MGFDLSGRLPPRTESAPWLTLQRQSTRFERETNQTQSPHSLTSKCTRRQSPPPPPKPWILLRRRGVVRPQQLLPLPCLNYRAFRYTVNVKGDGKREVEARGVTTTVSGKLCAEAGEEDVTPAAAASTAASTSEPPFELGPTITHATSPASPPPTDMQPPDAGNGGRSLGA